MIISLIVAMAENRVIGRDNKLPWHLPADLKYFKRVTLGKPIIMGRKTFQSIGRPLPGRANIIISRNPGFQAQGCTVVASVAAALEAAVGHDEAMVIGGATLFEQILPLAERIYLTEIHHDFTGDTCFPELDSSGWQLAQRVDCLADAQNPYDYSFLVLERQKSPT